MKVGLIGLANSGKSTIFNALTGQDVSVTNYPIQEAEPHLGVVKVPDARLGILSDIYKPKKVVHATVEYIDYLGITKGDAQQNRKALEMIKDVDAVVHVIRAFEDESVAHPSGNVDPLGDAGTVEVELVFSDLELVETRLQRMEELEKKGKKQLVNEEERAVLLRCKDALEQETPLRKLDFTDEENVAMRHLQFISIKPEVMLLNVHEDFAKKQDPAEELISEKFGLPVIASAGKIEMEIAQLGEEEARDFLEDLGIEEPTMYRLIPLCYRHLGLISFLTVGKDEVRAWTIEQGTTAQKAAGKIHSDIERGFIRAEVVSYKDFIECGSIAEARKKGLVRLEGKTYQVQDGDMIDFRFNV
ncbi:MAG: redox-regulated ATPase YchF [Planctomycetota bacterium]|jgi:GTP-binding protein YchF